MSLKNMYNGYKNLLDKKDVSIEAEAERQLQICQNCPFNSRNTNASRFRPDEHCTKCGCTLAAKARSMESSCPVGKW
jgi:hypothetical protein